MESRTENAERERHAMTLQAEINSKGTRFVGIDAAEWKATSASLSVAGELDDKLIYRHNETGAIYRAWWSIGCLQADKLI